MSKILLIDDDDQIVCMLKNMISFHLPKCEITTAYSGEEGIELALKVDPDTILLDVIMPPGMDGYEVCKTLRSIAKTSYTPIILITGIEFDTESRIKGLESGADVFLSKPFDTAELMAQIKSMLRIRTAEEFWKNKARKAASNIDMLKAINFRLMKCKNMPQ